MCIENSTPGDLDFPETNSKRQREEPSSLPAVSSSAENLSQEEMLRSVFSFTTKFSAAFEFLFQTVLPEKDAKIAELANRLELMSAKVEELMKIVENLGRSTTKGNTGRSGPKAKVIPSPPPNTEMGAEETKVEAPTASASATPPAPAQMSYLRAAQVGEKRNPSPSRQQQDAAQFKRSVKDATTVEEVSRLVFKPPQQTSERRFPDRDPSPGIPFQLPGRLNAAATRSAKAVDVAIEAFVRTSCPQAKLAYVLPFAGGQRAELFASDFDSYKVLYQWVQGLGDGSGLVDSLKAGHAQIGAVIERRGRAYARAICRAQRHMLLADLEPDTRLKVLDRAATAAVALPPRPSALLRRFIAEDRKLLGSSGDALCFYGGVEAWERSSWGQAPLSASPR